MSFATKTHYEIGFPKSAVTFIAGKQSKLNSNQVNQLVDNILNETLSLTIMELEIWIDDKVASRTGKLQEDLKLELKSSFVRDARLKLRLGTNISYAKFVNQMTTAMVRHVNQWDYAYYAGHHGKILLNDSRAIGFFFTKMLQYAEERLRYNLIKAKALYLGDAGRAGRMISSSFKWK